MSEQIENKLQKEFTDLCIEILNEDKYKNFLNIGLSSKQLKYNYSINFINLTTLKKKFYIQKMLDNIITSAFVEQFDINKKSLNIKNSSEFFDQSVMEYKKCLFDIEKEVSELDFMKQQTHKIRYCFYPSGNEMIYRYLTEIKYGKYFNEENIIYEAIRGLDGIYLTSGPIIDFNQLKIQNINRDIHLVNTYNFRIEIPLADVNIIKLELIDNTLNFQREEKLKRIID